KRARRNRRSAATSEGETTVVVGHFVMGHGFGIVGWSFGIRGRGRCTPPTRRYNGGMNIPLLKSLSEAAGVPGSEERVRKIVERECAGLFDQVGTDVMGNLIATKKSGAKDAKRVLIACHIDEIGFYVKHGDDKGRVKG